MLLISIYWCYLFIGLIPDEEIAYESARLLTYMLYIVMGLNFVISLVFAFFDIRYKVHLNRLKDKAVKDKELAGIRKLQMSIYPDNERSEIIQ